MAARRVSEADAVRAFLDRGARPLEPFPGTQGAWRCQCLTCGGVSSPRYNDVVNKGGGICNGTCRSQKIAAKLMRDGAQAGAVMLQWGWQPLGDYPGAGRPWLCLCLHCGGIKPKRLAHVQKGRGGCTSCAGRDVCDEAARAVMNEADLEPLVVYRAGLVPWLSRCLRCGHVGSPSYAKVRARGHQCWSCRAEKISRALQLSEQEAVASMLEKGLQPLEPYPGSVESPWRSRCTRCETDLVPGPALHNIRGAQGGCSVCARRGIHPLRPGYLYLLVHDDEQAAKWGIANLDYRVTQHELGGWRRIGRWDFDMARDAWAFERQIKAWVRGRGFPPAVPAERMRYGGHTETVSLTDISCTDLLAYTHRLISRPGSSRPA